MGALEHKKRGRVILPSHMLTGRQRSCFLLLSGPSSSAEHAVVNWTGTYWGVRDLGSRNGTRVDSQKLDPGELRPLRLGARVEFGDPSEEWLLVDDTPPEPMAINVVTREVRVGSGSMLALPDDEHPEAVVYEQSGTWTLEQATDVRPLSAAVEPISAGGTWMAYLPDAHELTPHLDQSYSVESATFRFFVSRNQEHVRIVVLQSDRQIVLEAREHYYLTLILAQHRLAQRDLPSDERGWMSRDQLVSILRTEVNLIDVAIHRTRRKLEAAGVLGAAGIVEVRRGERRFGSDRIEIIAE